MAQSRTTADLADSILRRAGELTDGNSPYESQVIDYLNQIHQAIIIGGNEFDVDIDESWPWAKAQRPIILELQPAHSTGSVSLTQGSEVGAFSAGPTESMEGRFLLIDNRPDYYRISQHTAGATAFELDSAYVGETGATLSYKALKLEYELLGEYLIVDSTNDKIDFYETAATELTATLTHGSYKTADLVTEVKTQLESSGASTYTISYDSNTRKFTLLSDGGGGGGIFSLIGVGTNAHRSAHGLLGLDQENLTGALTYTSTYLRDGVARLPEPFRIAKKSTTATKYGSIHQISELAMQKEFPIIDTAEGVPDNFTVIKESSDGKFTVRFNKYPSELTRSECEFIPVPRDLKDNAASVPLLPRKWAQVLEFGAVFYVLIDKEDSKAQTYAQLAGAKLKAMQTQNNKDLSTSGKDFARIIPRIDNQARRKNLIYGDKSS